METPEQRAERIFKEDEENRRFQYIQQFEQRQPKRANFIEQHKEALDAMINRKGKGIKFRRFFVNFVRRTATIKFKTDDEEYEHIGKAGRHYWSDSEEIEKAFTEQERELVYEIMLVFGAFDY